MAGAESLTVGFVGLGNMGLGMATNSLKGFPLIAYVRDEKKADELFGPEGQLARARRAASIEEVVQACDVFFVCLPSEQSSLHVLLEVALPVSRPGQIFIDTSTVSRTTTLECAAACEAKGVDFLDSPISGGPHKAADGTLTIMVGGKAEVFAKVRPILECMGTTVRLMGAQGAGTATKLVNQLLVGIHTVAACEAFLLGERLGVEDPGLLCEVLSTAFGYSRVLERHAPVIISRKFDNSPMPLRNMVKDLKIIAASAKEVGASIPLGEASEKLHAQLDAEGQGEWDMAVPFLLLDRQSTKAPEA